MKQFVIAEVSGFESRALQRVAKGTEGINAATDGHETHIPLTN